MNEDTVARRALERAAAGKTLPLAAIFGALTNRESKPVKLARPGGALTWVGGPRVPGAQRAQGFWSDGVEESNVVPLPAAQADKLAVALAQRNRQKSALWFTPGNGPDTLHVVSFGGGYPRSLARIFQKHGVTEFTVTQNPVAVHVVDQGGRNAGAVKAAAAEAGGAYEARPGTAGFRTQLARTDDYRRHLTAAAEARQAGNETPALALADHTQELGEPGAEALRMHSPAHQHAWDWREGVPYGYGKLGETVFWRLGGGYDRRALREAHRRARAGMVLYDPPTKERIGPHSPGLLRVWHSNEATGDLSGNRIVSLVPLHTHADAERVSSDWPAEEREKLLRAVRTTLGLHPEEPTQLARKRDTDPRARAQELKAFLDAIHYGRYDQTDRGAFADWLREVTGNPDDPRAHVVQNHMHSALSLPFVRAGEGGARYSHVPMLQSSPHAFRRETSAPYVYRTPRYARNTGLTFFPVGPQVDHNKPHEWKPTHAVVTWSVPIPGAQNPGSDRWFSTRMEPNELHDFIDKLPTEHQQAWRDHAAAHGLHDTRGKV